MQKRFEEKGRSMIEMLGVLGIIGVLTFAGFAGYQKAVTKTRINKTMDQISYIFQNFANFRLKNIKNIHVAGEDSMEDAISMGLVEDCELFDSQVDGDYQVCDVPLGEVYVRFEDMGKNRYSFLLFVTMIEEDASTCASFLTQGWKQQIPQAWWRNGMIWAASDLNPDGVVVYPENAGEVTPSQVATRCEAACPVGSTHCSMVFDFAGIRSRI